MTCLYHSALTRNDNEKKIQNRIHSHIRVHTLSSVADFRNINIICMILMYVNKYFLVITCKNFNESITHMRSGGGDCQPLNKKLKRKKNSSHHISSRNWSGCATKCKTDEKNAPAHSLTHGANGRTRVSHWKWWQV